MATQRQELVTTQFNFVPTTLKEAQEYATIFANSGLCPEGYRGRPNDILIVWQMGKELGLEKMQALRTLGCINGMPFAYGDGLLALIKRNPHFEDMKEWFEGSIETRDLTAYCTMMRKGKSPVTQKFSMEDAKLAGLWAKKGVWQQYPKRMLQHRARGFAAKDAFPDALFGLMSQDEVEGIVETSTVVPMPRPKNKGMQGLEESLGIAEDANIIDCEAVVVEDAQPEKENLVELKELIESRKVTKASITITLKKFGVQAFEGLTDEQIDKWTSHLKSRESK
jgi:hypothetical protein